MSFKQHLTENAIDIVNDCIAYLNMHNPNRVKHHTLAQNILTNAINSNVIYNVQYKDAYDFVGRSLEKCLGDIQDKEYYPNLRQFHNKNISQVLSDLPDVTTYSPFQSLSGNIKKIDKWLSKTDHDESLNVFFDYFKKIRDVLVKFSALLTIFKDLKGKIQKGRVPDPNAVPKFQPVFSQTEAKIILDKFKELTSEIRTKQIMQQEKYIHNLVEDYLNKIKDIPIVKTNMIGRSKRSFYEIYKENDQAKIILQSLIKHSNYYDDFELIENSDQKIKEMATRNIDDFHAQFISKNVQKLSGVIARKDNLLKIKTVRLTSGAYTLEAELDFIFADQAAFTVINKAVYATSKTGTPFVRFPTTFHDVVLSDGTKMKSPNEEKMNSDFK